MNPLFKNVKVIAWDMDTTLYKAVPELSIAFMNGCIEEVAKIKNLSLKDAEILLTNEKNKAGSTTQAFMNLGCGDFHTMWEVQKRVGKVNYLKKDPRLPLIFSQLSRFRHFLISNSVLEEVHTVLEAIGLNESYFEEIITVDRTGEPKPSPKPFKLMMELTGLKPEEHVMIGDMEKIDIAPAKKLGLKTILVWGKSDLADLSLPSVYDVAKVFV